MALPLTQFFIETLRAPYEVLLRTPAAERLSGNFRWDGDEIHADQVIDLLSDEVLGTREIGAADLAQLLTVFDGSRLHEQAQRDFGDDDSPPGLYFTYRNTELVWEGHKNRIGVYRRSENETSIFLAAPETDDEMEERLNEPERAVHVDHFYLHQHAPDYLGTITFALCAIAAHRLGFSTISLIAGGGHGYAPAMIGYKYWPKLGFDAPIELGELENVPRLQHYRTVQDVIAADPGWWEEHGTQRWMEFDLRAESPSWQKLLEYLRGKGLI